MGSTELGLGIVLVCVSVAIAAVWGSDREPKRAADQGSAQSAPIVDASAASVAENSIAP